MTISIPAASAAWRAAQFRGLIFGPVEGTRVPSISIAISWMLTPLFYLFFARLPGVSRNENPSDIIVLCHRLVTWSAPAAIPIFRLNRRKPFVLYVVASFWHGRRVPRTTKPGGKWIIAELSYPGDTGLAGLLPPSRAHPSRFPFATVRYGLVDRFLKGTAYRVCQGQYRI